MQTVSPMHSSTKRRASRSRNSPPTKTPSYPNTLLHSPPPHSSSVDSPSSIMSPTDAHPFPIPMPRKTSPERRVSDALQTPCVTSPAPPAAASAPAPQPHSTRIFDDAAIVHCGNVQSVHTTSMKPSLWRPEEKQAIRPSAVDTNGTPHHLHDDHQPTLVNLVPTRRAVTFASLVAEGPFGGRPIFTPHQHSPWRQMNIHQHLYPPWQPVHMHDHQQHQAPQIMHFSSSLPYSYSHYPYSTMSQSSRSYSMLTTFPDDSTLRDWTPFRTPIFFDARPLECK